MYVLLYFYYHVEEEDDSDDDEVENEGEVKLTCHDTEDDQVNGKDDVEDEEESSSSEEEEDEDTEVDKHFRDKVKQALGNAADDQPDEKVHQQNMVINTTNFYFLGL